MLQTPPEPRSFDSADLLDVIPIGATRRVAGREITLASIERYPGGFVAALASEEPADRAATTSVLAIDARDDRGGRYVGRLLYGHSASSPGGPVHHRMLYGFTPALADGVTALTLDGIDAASPGAAHAGPPGWTAVPEGERWSIALPLREVDVALDEPDAPRDLDDPGADPLRRVIAAGARQTAGDVTVVVYSLELYRTETVVLAGIECPGQAELLIAPDDWSATDDRGTSYRCISVAESENDPGAGLSGWRVDLAFAPGVDPRTRRLSLRIDGLRCLSGGGVAGPWQVDLDLAPPQD